MASQPSNASTTPATAPNKMEVFFQNEVKLPQYYQIFKDNGYEDIEFLNEFDTDNGDKELQDMGITIKAHKQRIISKISARKKAFNQTTEAKLVELPESKLQPKADDDANFNIQPAIAKSGIEAPTSGGQLSDVNVIIDMLKDDEKRGLYDGACELLRGRKIITNSGEIRPSIKRMFDLKGDDEKEKVKISDYVRPSVKKSLQVVESYSKLQHALSTSCYFNAGVLK